MSEILRKRSASVQEAHNRTSNKRRKPSLITPKSTNPKDTQGLSECFKTYSTSLYLSLAPLYTKDPLEGIKSQHLDTLIMKHFAPAGGVVIGYTNLKASEEHISIDEDGNESIIAKLNPHQPFAFLWVSVDFLVWKPQIGDVVEGQIYIQSPSHIALLINDTFNATIKKFNIPETWEFIPSQIDEVANDEIDGTDGNHRFQSSGQWIDENGIPVEGKIKFSIKAIHTTGRVVSVDGSLLAPGNEVEDKPVTPSVNKKIVFDDLEPSPENIEKSEIPTYDNGSDSDNGDGNDRVVAQKSSSEEENDSD